MDTAICVPLLIAVACMATVGVGASSETMVVVGNRQYSFQCDGTTVTLNTVEKFTDLVDRFNHYLEDGVKYVKFKLDLPDYEGQNPLLYNMSSAYGLWYLKWFYDQYGARLAWLPSSTRYTSLGLLYLEAKQFQIKFTTGTIPQDIAHLSDECKIDLALSFLGNVVTSSPEAESKEHYICYRYVDFFVLPKCGVCLPDNQCPTANATELPEDYKDENYYLFIVKIITMSIIFVVSYVALPFVYWYGVPCTSGGICKIFTLPNNEPVCINHSLLGHRQKPITSISHVCSYWAYTEPTRAAANRVGTGRSCCTNKLCSALKSGMWYCITVPLFAYVYFIVYLVIVKDSDRVKELDAWPGDTPKFHDVFLLVSNISPPYIIVFMAYYLVTNFVLAIIFIILSVPQLPRAVCTVHHETCPDRTTGSDHRHISECSLFLCSDQHPPETENVDIRTVYKQFLLSSDRCSASNPCIFEKFASLQYSLQWYRFNQLFHRNGWKACGLEFPCSLVCFPWVFLRYLWLSGPSIVYSVRDIHSKTLHSLFACHLFFTIFGIVIVDLYFITELCEFTTAGIVLNAKTVGIYITVVALCLTYLSGSYRSFTNYYKYLHDTIFEVCYQFNTDPDTFPEFINKIATFKTDILDDQANQAIQVAPCNQILLYKHVPFITSKTWQDCISADLFAFICENISPVRKRVTNLIFKLLGIAIFIVVITLIIKAFDPTLLVAAGLTALFGSLPKLLDVFISSSDNANKTLCHKQLQHEIASLIKLYFNNQRPTTDEGTANNVSDELEAVVPSGSVNGGDRNYGSVGRGVTASGVPDNDLELGQDNAVVEVEA